jgi:hypothetical protein
VPAVADAGPDGASSARAAGDRGDARATAGAPR